MNKKTIRIIIRMALCALVAFAYYKIRMPYDISFTKVAVAACIAYTLVDVIVLLNTLIVAINKKAENKELPVPNIDFEKIKSKVKVPVEEVSAEAVEDED